MKTIRLFVLFAFLIYLSNYSWGQESESITINNDTQQQQQERLKKEKIKAEQSKHLQVDPNSTNSRADENKLISKPYFIFRNQILDGMNVVGKGIIRKFDKQQTNEENIKALNEWVIENKELFKPEFLNKADEYFKEALKE